MKKPVLYRKKLVASHHFYVEKHEIGALSPLLCRSQMKARLGATSDNILLKVSLEEFPGSKGVSIRRLYWTTAKKPGTYHSLAQSASRVLRAALEERGLDPNERRTIYVKVDNL
jgi:hypothetical protein